LASRTASAPSRSPAAGHTATATKPCFHADADERGAEAAQEGNQRLRFATFTSWMTAPVQAISRQALIQKKGCIEEIEKDMRWLW
jgi:hypothetical protein